MALTYEWKLKSIKKIDSNGAIVGTQWDCIGTDPDGVSGTFAGATPFQNVDVDGDGFITYEELTEEIVLGWIKAVVVGSYKDHVDEQIQKQINEKKNPMVEVSGNTFPWVDSTTTAPTTNTSNVSSTSSTK